MRWILVCCFLLASASMGVFSTKRPRRDLWSFKHLISSKLFGTETIVIQLPKIPKNETSQLFKIKGYDNIFLKVTRQTDNAKPEHQKPKDPVMVSPEIAIIGSYLGTTTEGDTLFALEIAKNLVKSGVLSGERAVKIREPTKSDNVATTERDPIYVVPALNSNKVIEVVKPQPLPIYQTGLPPMVVASEVKFRPIQTKYSYKQESENADMKFESYNNQDVIVTRTDKVPDKPRYVTLRLAEVASIGANPCLITPRQCNSVITQEHILKPFNLMDVPIHSFVSENVPNSQSVANIAALKQSDTAPSNDINVEVPNFIKEFNQPFDIRDHLSDSELEKLNMFINAKLNQNKKTTPSVNLNTQNDGRVPYITKNIQNYQNYLDAKKYGNLMHRYVYQQMGDVDQEPTHVAIEDPKLNETIHIVKTSDDVPQDFVYVPPLDANVPPLPNGVAHEYVYPENNDYGLFVEENNSRGDVSLPNNENQPTPTSKNMKNMELVTFSSIRNDDAIYTSTLAPPKTTKGTKYPTTSTFKRVNDVTRNVKPTTAKSSSYETTSTSTDNLAIVSLNVSNEMNQSNTKAGTLKTNIKDSAALKKKPIEVAGMDRNASTVKNYRPRLHTTSARSYTGGPVF